MSFVASALAAAARHVSAPPQWSITQTVEAGRQRTAPPLPRPTKAIREMLSRLLFRTEPGH